MAASIQSFASLVPAALTSPVGLTEGLPLIGLVALAWLFTYALHSTLLLGSAWIVTRRLSDARAGLRERVWKFAVLGAFVTASVQTGMGFEPLGGRLPLSQEPALAQDDSPASLRPDAPPSWPLSAAAELVAAPGNPFLGSALFATLALERLDPLARWSATSLVQEAPSSVAGPDAIATETPEIAGVASASQDGVAALPWSSKLGGWTRWAFATAALGAFAGLCLFGLLWLRLNGCLQDRVELKHGVLFDRLQELRRRAGLRRAVRLSVAPSLGAPISMGMFRAEICVPPRVLLELSEEEQEALLAHELAHVVRRDPLWLATCRLCEGVFFFQPLHRVARHEIEDCAEFLSDAWAVRHTGLRFSLASCLTRIAEWIVGDRRHLPAPAMAHGRSRLRHRVELLLDESSAENVDRHPRWLGFACTGFCATLVAVVPCVSASAGSDPGGDGASIPFLPQRDRLDPLGAVDEPGTVELALDELGVPAASMSAQTAPVAAASSARNDELDELKDEIDGLAAEVALLRDEASQLQLQSQLARDVANELKLMEMKLARLRELSARVDLLRAAPRASRAPTRQPDRAARSNTPIHPPTSNAPTAFSNRKEDQ